MQKDEDNISLGRGLESLIPNKQNPTPAVPRPADPDTSLGGAENKTRDPSPAPFVIHKQNDTGGEDEDEPILPDPLKDPELPDPLDDPELPGQFNDPELPAGDYHSSNGGVDSDESTPMGGHENIQRGNVSGGVAVSKEPQKHESVFNLEVDKIKANPHQPRRDFNDEALADLAASIREFGVLQPLVVTKKDIETPGGRDVEYELIAGERRLKASKIAGLERVPAIVRHVGLERERLEMAIIENLQREDLNPIEMARALSRLQDEFRLTQREIASRLGKSRATVANTLRLLDLPHDIQKALAEQKISESHGRLLLGVEDPGLREKLFRDLLNNPITTRDLRGKIRATRSRRSSQGSENVRQEDSPELKMIEERLRSELGTPVDIKAKGDHGKITISFYSKEELMNILSRFNKEE